MSDLVKKKMEKEIEEFYQAALRQEMEVSRGKKVEEIFESVRNSPHNKKLIFDITSKYLDKVGKADTSKSPSDAAPQNLGRPGKWSVMAAALTTPPELRDAYLGCRDEAFGKDAERFGRLRATCLYNWDTARDLARGLIGRVPFGKILGIELISRYFT